MQYADSLLSSTPGVLSAKDAVIQELYVAGNYKQALVNLDRLMKKKQSERLLINKALILLSTPDPERRKQGSEELVKILNSKPPLTDLDALTLIDGINWETQPEVQNHAKLIWERAAQHTKNEELGDVWFRSRFSRQDFKGAQKAAFSLLKSSSNQRTLLFRSIVSAYLLSTTESSALAPHEVQFYSSFTMKLIDKAATDSMAAARTGTPKAAEPQAALRNLQTANDLGLLLAIYRSQDKLKEALDILNDEQLVKHLTKDERPWSLVLHKLEILELMESWDQLGKFSYDLLADADHARNPSIENGYRPVYSFGASGDDWKVWKARVLAGSKSEDHDATKKLGEDLEKFQSLNKRHHLLAELESGALAGEPRVSSLRERVCDYFMAFGDKQVVYSDLRPYLSRVPLAELPAIISRIAESAEKVQGSADTIELKDQLAWISAEIASLKIEYSFVIAHEHGDDTRPLISEFVANCLRLHALSQRIPQDVPITERRCGDDAAILAAVGCIRLFYLGESNAMLRAICVLEDLVAQSPHNYDALILLIRLYMYEGAASKAFEHYSKLDLKNIQHLSWSWLLLTRISTLFPSFSSQTSLNSFKLLQKCLDTIDNLEASNNKLINGSLETENWPLLLSASELMKTSASSMAKLGMRLELANIDCRLKDVAKNVPSLQDLSLPHTLIDVRDKDAYPNYEPCFSPSLEQYIQTGPFPLTAWHKFRLRVSLLRYTMAYMLQEDPIPGADIQQWEDCHRALSQSVAEYKGLSEAEVFFAKIVDGIWRVLEHIIGGADAPVSNEKRSAIYAVMESNEKRLLECGASKDFVRHPLSIFELIPWEFFHNFYLMSEAMDLHESFVRIVLLLNRDWGSSIGDPIKIKSTVDRSRRLTETIKSVWSDYAEVLHTLLLEPGFSKGLHARILDPRDENDVVAKELCKSDTKKTLAKFEELKSSWSDGLKLVRGAIVK